MKAITLQAITREAITIGIGLAGADCIDTRMDLCIGIVSNMSVAITT